jgi:glutathione S-transferase
MELLIGPRAYSTWSLRGWLVMEATGADFTTTPARYDTEDDRRALRARSPSGFVPILRTDEGEVVWDTLGIAEWAADRFPEARLWPADPTARAYARCAAAEMHSGFSALRTLCATGPDHPMIGDARAPMPVADEALSRDLQRVVALFTSLRDRFGGSGGFLFGDWSIADAFFTPVAARVRHYQIDLGAFGDRDGVARRYCQSLLDQPAFRRWEADALAEDA